MMVAFDDIVMILIKMVVVIIVMNADLVAEMISYMI